MTHALTQEREYRLFFRSGARRAHRPAEAISAGEDADAIDQAKSLAEGYDAELWIGYRLVAWFSRQTQDL